jgi:DNA-binding FadR family transcriptional regulator
MGRQKFMGSTKVPTDSVPLGRISRPQRASEIAADQIRQLILTGQLKEGSMLPPETQLVTQLGISRTSLREAFRILETEDLITVSRGSRSGAQVHQPNAATAARYAGQALTVAGATIEETYEAQLAFEPFAARLLAQRATPALIRQLEAAASELEGFIETDNFLSLSRGLARFHFLIVELTGNRTLAIMAEMLTLILESYQGETGDILRTRDLDTAAARKFRGLGVRSIRKLVALIKAKDADGAEAHWRAHLTNSSKYWLAK